MKKILLFFIALVVLAGCEGTNWNCIDGSEHLTAVEPEIDGFHTVMYDRSGFVLADYAETPYLRLETDDNLIDKFTFRVIDSVLYIQTQDDLCPSEVNIYCNAPLLKKIHMAGSGTIRSGGRVLADGFQAILDGSGWIDMLFAGNINADLRMGGSGDIKIGGNAGSIEASIDGSGDITSSDIIANSADLRIDGSGGFNMNCEISGTLAMHMGGSGTIRSAGKSDSCYAWMGGSGNLWLDDHQTRAARYILDGSGDIRAWAMEYLFARIDGSGNIFYKGDPEHLDAKIDGSGNIQRIQ